MDHTILANLLPSPEGCSELDLDSFRDQLAAAAGAWADLEDRARLYETELQRELRAKVDLAGGIPACPEPEIAFTLQGLDLLAARHAASRKFNDVFSVSPLRRNAPKPTPTGAVH
jgi:hypothetical protein